jgi:hypothetical protein
MMSFMLNSSFSPDDVDVLRGALNNWCMEKRLNLKSAEAQFAASAAIDLFQSGHNTSEKLLAALREHRAL